MVFYTVLINLNLENQITREIQTLISVFLVRKSLLDHIFTKSVESALFIAGMKIKVIVTINSILNNTIYLFIALLMYFLNLTTVNSFLENFLFLNILICISIFLKYFFITEMTNSSFLKTILQQFIYYGVFGILYYSSLNFIPCLALIFFSHLILLKQTNKFITYDDIN